MASRYERYDAESGKVMVCPRTDYDGKITGKCVVGVPEYFDENPEERIAGGWKLVIQGEKPTYDSATQYLQKQREEIDANTIRETWNVLEKPEEMLLMDELFVANDDALMNALFFGEVD